MKAAIFVLFLHSSAVVDFVVCHVWFCNIATCYYILLDAVQLLSIFSLVPTITLHVLLLNLAYIGNFLFQKSTKILWSQILLNFFFQEIEHVLYWKIECRKCCISKVDIYFRHWQYTMRGWCDQWHLWLCGCVWLCVCVRSLKEKSTLYAVFRATWWRLTVKN